MPVLALHGVIPGANLPVEVFALASTLLILLPTALWVTSITDGRTGVRALFARVFRWRFGIGWWVGAMVHPTGLGVAVYGMPQTDILVIISGPVILAGAIIAACYLRA